MEGKRGKQTSYSAPNPACGLRRPSLEDCTEEADCLHLTSCLVQSSKLQSSCLQASALTVLSPGKPSPQHLCLSHVLPSFQSPDQIHCFPLFPTTITTQKSPLELVFAPPSLPSYFCSKLSHSPPQMTGLTFMSIPYNQVARSRAPSAGWECRGWPTLDSCTPLTVCIQISNLPSSSGPIASCILNSQS